MRQPAKPEGRNVDVLVGGEGGQVVQQVGQQFRRLLVPIDYCLDLNFEMWSPNFPLKKNKAKTNLL